MILKRQPRLKQKPNYIPPKGNMTPATYRKHTKVFVGLMKELLEVGEFDSMSEDELVEMLVDEFVMASDSMR